MQTFANLVESKYYRERSSYITYYLLKQFLHFKLYDYY